MLFARSCGELFAAAGVQEGRDDAEQQPEIVVCPRFAVTMLD